MKTTLKTAAITICVCAFYALAFIIGCTVGAELFQTRTSSLGAVGFGIFLTVLAFASSIIIVGTHMNQKEKK